MNPHVQIVPEMSQETAAVIVALLQRRAGISIPQQKTDLLRNRLGRRLFELRLVDFDDYAEHLGGPNGAAEAVKMVEALTTHTTSFFREDKQYKWLASAGLPEMVERGLGVTQELLVWSAACSTGAELYSAAMVIEEFGRARCKPLLYRATGTDISRPILAKATSAVYTESEIAGVPEDLRRTYILKSRNGRTGADGRPLYRIAPETRARASFLQANLIALDQAPRIAADIVFLRNVLIYFNRTEQNRIVRSVVARLRDGGYLLTGHAEALPDVPPGLRAVMSSVYQKDT